MPRSIVRIRRRIFLATLLCLLGALLVTATINLTIDPYGTFRLVDIPELNRIKPYPDHDLAVIKNHALRHVAPQALILGNSRAEVGLDPEHPAWRAAGYESVYNAAVAGGGPSTAAKLADRAFRSERPPRFILLGVDFFDFPVAPNSKEAWREPADSPQADSLWRLRATLTMQALLDSAITVVRQFQRNPEQLTPLGHNPLLEYIDISKAEGYWVLFRQRAEENARNHARKPKNLFLAGSRTSPSFEGIRDIVRQAIRSDAELCLVIYPYHAQLLLMIDELGLWPLFEEWKRELVHLVEDEARTATGRRIVMDFSGFSDYAGEAIPEKNDRRTSTRWYWEAGHFKKSLGDVMLDAILRREQTPPGSRNFEAELSSRNMERHLAQQRSAKEDFRQTHPELVREIRSLLGKGG